MVINDDEGDHLEGVSMLSTPFNAVLAQLACMSTCYGRGGHLWVQKWSETIFSKDVPRPLGVLEQVFEGYFESFLIHISACKLPKTLEMGNISTISPPFSTDLET